MLWPTWLVACQVPSPVTPPTATSATPPVSTADSFCDELLADGLPDDDCDGTRADVVPIGDAVRLELIGSTRSALGASVACTRLPFGDLPNAIAAGAPYDEWAGVNERVEPGRGAVWVVDGARTGVLYEADMDFVGRANVEDYDHLGADVAFAGDVDGDGADELVATAPAARLPEDYSGGAYLVDGDVLGEVDLSASAIVFPGVTSFSRLSHVTPAGDLDGDGRADLVVTAPPNPGPHGALVYVFRGPLPQGELDVAAEAAVVYRGDDADSTFGRALAGCDLDGDGDDELVLGSERWSEPASPFSPGRVQVVDGGPWRIGG